MNVGAIQIYVYLYLYHDCMLPRAALTNFTIGSCSGPCKFNGSTACAPQKVEIIILCF